MIHLARDDQPPISGLWLAGWLAVDPPPKTDGQGRTGDESETGPRVMCVSSYSGHHHEIIYGCDLLNNKQQVRSKEALRWLILI